eukprot:CAMPEP_0174887878 /NCGR_PEP_ID=MMETSP0167-20121228/3095_1 /TAXON_ID=38298 /ORGANISM="Rhodella maculata, Strain CCMP736" /LENGTH=178 /DNA_ID=CAMNT_0016124559 /DNA_START=17 /DNA_END=553 /DNA_ORIENTATION=+
MTTIDDFSDELDKQILECGNWIVGTYVSLASKSGKIDAIKEGNQIVRALKGLLGDKNLLPRFEPAIKLIESTYCMNEYKKRDPLVKDAAKTLQLSGKTDLTQDNIMYYVKKLPTILAQKCSDTEAKAFLTYLLFIGRNVGEAAGEKGSDGKVSDVEKKALKEIADAFGVDMIPDDLMK